jgi:uncharacterized membrane protein
MGPNLKIFHDSHDSMEGVEQVCQVDDKHLHWKATIGGKQKEWDAFITEQIPDQRIAWMSQGGAKNGRIVMFSKISESKSRLNFVWNMSQKVPSRKQVML